MGDPFLGATTGTDLICQTLQQSRSLPFRHPPEFQILFCKNQFNLLVQGDQLPDVFFDFHTFRLGYSAYLVARNFSLGREFSIWW